MPLHMVKLCVGADSIEDLRSWVEERLETARREGRVPEQFHQTRMQPKRGAEIVDGGSLFWVIKGNVQVRQRVLELRPVTGEDGIARCRIILEPVFIATHWQPRRPFQGWRYLKGEDAPPDLGDGEDLASLPSDLRRELAGLGLL